jgi:HEAT repeat protein
VRRVCLIAVLLLCGFDWPGQVDRLITRLERPSSEAQRRDVLRLLGAIDSPRAREALARASTDPSPALRAEALRALAKRPDASQGEAVRVALKDPDTSVRTAAIDAVGALHLPDAVALLTRSLSDSEPAVRAQGARVLGRLGDRAAVPALSSALDDASTDVRVAAARALAALGDDRALDPLLSKARDNAPELREAVVEALAAFAPEQSAPVLVQALGDTSDVVVLAALRAIGKRDVSPWLSYVRELAESPRPRVRSAAEALLVQEATQEREAHRVHSEAPWLALLEETAGSDPSRMPALADELETALPEGEELAAAPLLDWLTRAPGSLAPRIVRLIGRTHAKGAVGPLSRRLESASRPLELALIDALGELGGHESVNALMTRLDGDDPRVRDAAARALLRTADTRELPALRKLLGHGRPSVRKAALRVLSSVLAHPRAKLDADHQAKLLRALVELVEAGDHVEFALASRCLGLLGGRPALSALGTGAGLDSDARRMAAIRASAHVPSARSLRQVEENASPALRAVALEASALGGDPLAFDVLAKHARSAPWPLGPASAFALARASQPERAARLEPILCSLLDTADPWTRANVLAGLARLPNAACADGAGLDWLRHARAESVRVAAAHWARARESTAASKGELTRALATCAAHDSSALVRAACAGESAKALNIASGGGVCGLLLPGGFVLVSFPDAAGDPSWPRIGYIGVELAAHAPYGRE